MRHSATLPVYVDRLCLMAVGEVDFTDVSHSTSSEKRTLFHISCNDRNCGPLTVATSWKLIFVVPAVSMSLHSCRESRLLGTSGKLMTLFGFGRLTQLISRFLSGR